ncbi:MAG: hypothetical protein L0Y36_00035, partial [Planctomycetales bacterium]|nr:hypothetical protein [Planctomycetales bacterium]
MAKSLLNVLVLAMVVGVVCAADKAPKTPDDIEVWWKDGKTLPLETTALYPLKEQQVKDDTGINVLVDMSHKCDFFTLWTLGGYINRMG